MRQQWQQALALEGKCAEILTEMTDRGWLIDQDRIRHWVGRIDLVVGCIDAKVLPLIPELVKKIGAKGKCAASEKNDYAVNRPFKKNGSYSAACLKYFPELEEEDCTFEVVGKFCRFMWVDINLNSDKQVKKYLLSVGWKPTEWNVKKEGPDKGARTSPKLTLDSFDSLQGDTGKLIAKRLKYKHRCSQLTGWLRDVREDGRLPQEISGITPTFRYTHKKIVNVPSSNALLGKAMRGCFVAKPGYTIVGVDAASCQLRMLCNYMGDPVYTEYVLNGTEEAGTDPHTMNMKMSGGIIKDRGVAKRFIYGFLFGAGNGKIGSTVGGNSNTGKKLRRIFLENLPQLAKLLSGLTKAWKKNGYIKGLDGRKIYVRSEHMLLVYLLQCAEALLMKVALVMIHERVKAAVLDAGFVAFVHDELQAEVKDEDVESYKDIAEQAMSDAGERLKLSVPSAGTPKSGKNWAHTH